VFESVEAAKPVLLDAAGERPCYPPLDGNPHAGGEPANPDEADIGDRPGAGRLLFSE